MTKGNLMKIRLATVMIMGLGAALAQADDKDSLKDQKAKVSYSIGVSLGNQWRQQDIDIDSELVLRGIKEAMAGTNTLLTETEVRQVLNSFQQEHRAKMMEKRRQLGEKNKADGEMFLAENKTKAGVITLPSGLQYKVMEEGKGESPKATDTVTVNYRGTLTD